MLPVVTAPAGMLAVWLALVAPVSPETAAGTVTGLQILPAPERTEVVISLEGEVTTRDFTMEGPDRVVVDLLGARFSSDSEQRARVDRGGILTLRASQYDRDVVRVVLELDRPVEHVVQSGDGYVRISLHGPGETFQPWSLSVPEPTSPNAGVAVPATASADNGEARGSRAATNRRGIVADEFSRRISVSFSGTPMQDVLFTFSEFSGRSIVPGAGVAGMVSADIRNQPWDIALQTILESHGLAAREYDSGIIRVDRLQDLTERAEVEQLVTRPFRVNYGSALDLQPAIESLLSSRGRISVSASTNSLVVTDVPSVLEAVDELLMGLDLETPEVTISAKIIFVNRTDLAELGIVYDLKDMRGNQLNVVTPGLIDSTGDGNLNEQVDPPTNVISLRGNSIAALGNARQRVATPSLQFLNSIVMGRMTLLTFVEALESVQLSDIQAAPQVKVLDNRPARIQVGERTPVRGVQRGQQQGGDEGSLFIGAPQIEFVETGIILEVTPTITAGDLIFMDLRAERSGVEEVGIELGYRFNTQEAHTQVLVEDGETVVIGGLTVTEVEESRVGIPILQHLPFVGRAFRFSSQSRIQQDLIIMVTPQITRR